ncbi:MAG: hypothetical protein HYY35_02720 [Deltaproteobacteria bacterium]|nr:hypothetical protein [Deltaproteobacteria bacterium]
MSVARRAGAWRNVAAAVGVLVPIAAFVVYSSFQVSAVECEVCMRFAGREICRSASARSRFEALRGAADNACALLTSGMTNTIRCQQGEPARSECRALDGSS